MAVKNTTKAARFHAGMSKPTKGITAKNDGAMIHSAPNLSAKCPMTGIAANVGADAITMDEKGKDEGGMGLTVYDADEGRIFAPHFLHSKGQSAHQTDPQNQVLNSRRIEGAQHQAENESDQEAVQASTTSREGCQHPERR